MNDQSVVILSQDEFGTANDQFAVNKEVKYIVLFCSK